MSWIEETRNARSRRTAAALLTAARELIEREGFSTLTMSAVAERAGISRRAVYLHFAGRAQLLAALYRSLGDTEELAASLEAVWESPTALAGLTEWAAHIARSHPRILAVLQAVGRARFDDADAADIWNTAQGNWLKGCRRLMRWLADEGHLSLQWTAESAADMMWALMSIDVLDRLLNERHWSHRTLADRLAHVFHATFTTSGGR